MILTEQGMTWGVILMNKKGGKIMKLKYFLSIFLIITILMLLTTVSYCTEKELKSEDFIQGSIEENGKIGRASRFGKLGDYPDNKKYKFYLSFNLSKIPKGSTINSAKLIFNYKITNAAEESSLNIKIKNIDYGLYLDKKDYNAANLSKDPVNYSLSTSGTNCNITVNNLVKDAFTNIKPWRINESRYYAQFSIEVINDNGCINIDLLKNQIVLKVDYD